MAKDYKNDIEAVEPTSNKGKDDKDTDPDDLVAAFGQLGVTRKCQMCTTVYVGAFLHFTIPLTRIYSLDSSNTGEGEWKTHCVDCVPLAIQAKEAEEERPSSAKTRMILKLLNDIDERSDCEEKTIIFSQFTSMLDLIEPFLHEEGVKYVRCKTSSFLSASQLIFCQMMVVCRRRSVRFHLRKSKAASRPVLS